MSPGADSDFTFTPFHRGGAGSPLVCLHGFADTWRTWELVLPVLERRHDVLALTLPGHAGGPQLPAEFDLDDLVDALEGMLDEAGLSSAHLVGNSLGGYLALRLAVRGRAETVVALSPAGGWALGDSGRERLLEHQQAMLAHLRAIAPRVDAILASPQGRRRVTRDITTDADHIPDELLAHVVRGAALCPSAPALLELAAGADWPLDPGRVVCPVRIVWGTADELLPWPAAAARYLTTWLPHADWVELEGVGHCPQLNVPLETAHLILDFATS